MAIETPTWIRDPVHGAIRLTDLERRVVDCACFQRLRRIKQLGLACLAFPSADYPRFEHSLGVLQVMGRMLDVLQAKLPTDLKLTDHEIKEYRLAALLHDIGHYPFSHAMEHALAEAFSKSLVQSATELERSVLSPPASPPLKHERVGKLIVTTDGELSGILREAGFEPDKIARIFNREDPKRFENLISSDLDADRLDYLARTAKHTGLPYGITDIDYIVEHLCVDDKERVCLDGKALRAAEHMLLARYFDYQTLVYQRTVAGTELLLKEALVDWVRDKDINCSENGLVSKLSNGEWSAFDDVHVMNELRKYRNECTNDVKRALLRCVLDRVPPKAVAEAEWLDKNDKNAKANFNRCVKLADDKLSDWAKKANIPKDYWRIWSPGRASLTKSSASVSTSEAAEANGKDQDNFVQAIRIRKTGSMQSEAILEMPRSLMSILTNHSLYAFRIYVIPPDGIKVDRKAIRQIIVNDSGSLIDWK